MFTQLKAYPCEIRLLLLGSLLLTVSRAMTLPYVVLYLDQRFGLNAGSIGLVIGSSLLLGTAVSMYGGHVVDRLPRMRLLASSIAVFAACFVLATLASQVWLFLVALTMLNASYAIIDIATKAYFGDTLASEQRLTAFSIKYTLTNVGFALGPMLGVALARINTLYPFLASAALALGFLLFFVARGRVKEPARGQILTSGNFMTTLTVLLGDRRLVLFVFGGLLSAIVFGQFTAYLSQYLLATTTPAFAYQVVSQIVTINAIVVITLQYTVGKWLSQRHLFRWLVSGLALLIAGSIGFSLAESVLVWALSMVIFSLGEIIVIPAEYLFIDHIAPEQLRGSYYGAQNLTSLGAALGPILCGYVLSGPGAQYMFPLLICTTLAGGLFYFFGLRCK